MVVVHDRGKAAKRPMKRDSFAVAPKQQTFEQLKTALEQQGFDHRDAFALVALDERGHVRVHASGEIKGYLDELQLESQYQQAVELARHEPSLAASQRAASISEQHGIEATDFDAGEDDAMSIFEPQPQIKVKGRRVYRPTRHRGRSMLPRDAFRFACMPYPPPEQTIREVAPSDTEDEPRIRPSARKMLKSFRIDDYNEVTKFLATRLKRMQQLADKKIAKAWIKGICPKKQAKFPYQNQKQHKGNGAKPIIPAWWPSNGCRFIEPDHIRREERMALCLHLLRLRPKPDQLKAWNHHDVDPNPTHVSAGWTAFLNELAGAEIFDDLPKETPERTKMRQTLMSQMYTVARMEEEFFDGARDGEDMFAYEDDEEDRKPMVASKRNRRQSVASLDENDDRRSESVSCTRVKRARKESAAVPVVDAQRPLDQKQDIEMLDMHTPQLTRGHMLPGSIPFANKDNRDADNSFRQHEYIQQPTGQGSGMHIHTQSNNMPAKYETLPPDMRRQADNQAQLWRVPDPNSGPWVGRNASPHFGQQFSGVETYQPQQAVTEFPGKRGYEFPQYHSHGQNQIQVHQVGQVPQPEFHSLPGTPLFTPSGLMQMPMHSYPIQSEHHLPQQQPYSTTMQHGQFFMPAQEGPAVVDFQAHMSVQQPPPYHPDHAALAQRHITPMQRHELPFAQPGAWPEHP